MVPGFSRYAKEYVEEQINLWQKKGEYEKTDDYICRIETQRDAKIKEFTQEAKAKYLNDQQPANLKGELTLSNYNADAEIYVISHPRFGDFIMPVSPTEAPDVKGHWYEIIPEASYVIENDRIAIESILFKKKRGKTKRDYACSRANAADYSEPEITFNFDPVEIEVEKSVPQIARNTSVPVKAPEIVIGKSDIDINIPVGNKTANALTFAVIIANENYRRVSKVDYAHNDGTIMKKYLVETLGIPENQIHMVKDATLNDMKGELEWMKEVSDAYYGYASFIFYYAGHGIPDESTANGYLLPVDGYGSMSSSGLAMNELNEKISSIPSQLSLIILDACFSGAMRNGDMLASNRGVMLKVKPSAIQKGNVVVMSASQNDEVASKIDEHRHGLFTYFLLKKIQESKGNVKLGDLADYVKDQVRRYSVVNNRKPQTPAVLTSPMIKGKWDEIVLKKIDE